MKMEKLCKIIVKMLCELSRYKIHYGHYNFHCELSSVDDDALRYKSYYCE